MKNPAYAVLGALIASQSVAAGPLRATEANKTNIWDFALLQPSPEFQWTPCFDNFTCTVLEVPLDYSDGSAGTVGIAFIKWTAANSTSAQDILVNPGGPGGSGVFLVQQHLAEMQAQLGVSNNLIGFDPRGVNNSGPQLSCFPGKRDTWKLYNPQWNEAVDSTSTSSMAEHWTQAGAFGEWCNTVHHPGSKARYVNTVATATDMLHYVELAAEAKGQKKEDAKLWYYGASYGTILGSTFAALFPDRIGRMMLDGVVDWDDYYQGKWEKNIIDADAAFRAFFKDCFNAGKEVCDFWDESPEAIERRFEAMLKNIAEFPITVTDRKFVDTPVVLTASNLKTYLAKLVYDPITWSPEVAAVLADVEKRNGNLLAKLTGAGISLDVCPINEAEPNQIEPRYVIACNDAGTRFNLSTIDAWTDHVHLLVNQSKWLGELWAFGPAGCRSLDISNHVPESQRFITPPSVANTSAPILYISTKIDPVTPLKAAEKMSALFGNSGLLVQNSVGHASISSHSTCSYNARQKYLTDATLPAKGIVCEPDQVPFQTQGKATGGKSLMEALWKGQLLVKH